MISRNHFVGNHLHVPPILLISLYCLITNIPRNDDFFALVYEEDYVRSMYIPTVSQTFYISSFILVFKI